MTKAVIETETETVNKQIAAVVLLVLMVLLALLLVGCEATTPQPEPQPTPTPITIVMDAGENLDVHCPGWMDVTLNTNTMTVSTHCHVDFELPSEANE